MFSRAPKAHEVTGKVKYYFKSPVTRQELGPEGSKSSQFARSSLSDLPVYRSLPLWRQLLARTRWLQPLKPSDILSHREVNEIVN